MAKNVRHSGNGAFVSVGNADSSRRGSNSFFEIRRPDGATVVGMKRDTYERALSSAKAVLNKRENRKP